MKKGILKKVGLEGASTTTKVALTIGAGTVVGGGLLYNAYAGTEDKTEPVEDTTKDPNKVVDNSDTTTDEKDTQDKTNENDTNADTVTPVSTNDIVYENDAMKLAKEELKEQGKKPDENKTEDTEKDDDEKVEDPDLSLINAKKELVALITSIINMNKEDYTVLSYNEIQEVVKEATELLGNENISVDDILSYVETLKTNKENLVSIKELKSEVVVATKEMNKAYTSESKKEVEKALETAKTVLDNKSATKEDVLSARKMIKESMSMLKADTTILEKIIKVSEKTNKEDWSTVSYENLKTVTDSAKEKLAKGNLTIEEVNALTKSISDKINSLSVDTTILKSNLETAKTFKFDDFTDESFEVLSTKIKEVENFLKENHKQFEINTMLDELTMAVNQLDSNVTELDKTEIKKLVAEVNGFKEDVYTPNSWKTFAEKRTVVLENASSIIGKKKATAEEIATIINELKDVKSVLVERANTTELKNLMNEINTLKEDAYTPNSWKELKESKDKANKILNNFNVTNQEVSDIVTELTNAKTNLVKRANKESLKELIVVAENSMKESYTKESKKVLQTSIDDAKTIIDDLNVTQTTVDEKIVALNNAIFGLTADTTELEKVVADAEPELEKAYSDETKSSLENAINNAKVIIAKNSRTLEEVRLAKVSISEALQKLVPDTSNLNASIVLAKKYELKDYTDDTFNTLQEAIKKAEIVLNNPTLENVKEASTNLAEAIGNLKAFVPANTTELGKLIIKSENVGETDYYKDSYMNLQSALTTAKKVVTTNRVSQEEVDNAYNELNTAYNNLYVNKTDLETLVNNSANYKEEDYISGFDEFKDAWNSADALAKNKDAKQSEVDNQVESLKTAIGNLQAVNHADKTGLENLLKEVESLVESDYTPKSWTVYDNAKTTALNVMDNRNATQLEVENAIINLANAKNDLVSKANKDALNEAITTAESKTTGNYTVETLNNLTSKLEIANGVKNDENVTQDEVDRVTTELNNAISSLKENVDISVLQEKIKEAKAIDKAIYTNETYANLQTAINDAETTLNDENKTQDKVNIAVQSLVDAMNQLEEVPTVASKHKELEKVVAEADELLANTNIQAPSNLKKVLEERVTVAKDFLDDPMDQLTIEDLQQQIDIVTAKMKDYTDNQYDVQGMITKAQAKVAEFKALNPDDYSTNSYFTANYYCGILEERIQEGDYEGIKSAYDWFVEEMANLEPRDTNTYVNEQAPGEVLALLNAERKAQGLGELTLDSTLCQATTIRATEAQYQTGNFADWAHKRPDGRKWSTVLSEVGFSGSYYGENAARGQASGESLYNAWYNSEGHRNNMMNPEFTKVGISMVKVGEGSWVSYMILSN